MEIVSVVVLALDLFLGNGFSRWAWPAAPYTTSSIRESVTCISPRQWGGEVCRLPLEDDYWRSLNIPISRSTSASISVPVTPGPVL